MAFVPVTYFNNVRLPNGANNYIGAGSSGYQYSIVITSAGPVTNVVDGDGSVYQRLAVSTASDNTEVSLWWGTQNFNHSNFPTNFQYSIIVTTVPSNAVYNGITVAWSGAPVLGPYVTSTATATGTGTTATASVVNGPNNGVDGNLLLLGVGTSGTVNPLAVTGDINPSLAGYSNNPPYSSAQGFNYTEYSAGFHSAGYTLTSSTVWAEVLVMLNFSPLPTTNLPLAIPHVYYTYINAPLTLYAPGLLIGCAGTGLTVIAHGTPANGTFNSFGTDGSFVYTPNLGYLGNEFFSYTILDSQGMSSTAIANIQVNPLDKTGMVVTQSRSRK